MTTLWGPALDAEIRYRQADIQAAGMRRRAARPRRNHKRRPAPARATGAMAGAMTASVSGRR